MNGGRTRRCRTLSPAARNSKSKQSRSPRAVLQYFIVSMSERHLNRRMVELCFVLDYSICEISPSPTGRKSEFLRDLIGLFFVFKNLITSSDCIPITVIDTSSSIKCSEEQKRVDAVMLMYANDQPMTLTRISSFWLPKLRRLEVNVPIVLVGCKLDLRDEHDSMSMEQVMTPIMQWYREIETCI